MNDDLGEVWKREEIESPCQKLCVIHEPSGLCMGCYRTRFEIAGWSRLSAKERADLMIALPDRADQVKGTRRRRR